jgi:uncharacterized membrane protein HdeD (DUF308 family)
MALFEPAPAAAGPLHAHWRLFLIEGTVLAILGCVAIAVPLIAGLVAAVVLGWVFVLAGIAGLVSSYGMRRAPGFGWSLASGVLALAAGLLLLWNPIAGLASLTYVLIGFFIADGVAIIFMAIEHRRELSRRWEWMLLNGVIDLLLAGIIISGLPGTLAWALGLLLGVDLIFGGASLIAMALAAR